MSLQRLENTDLKPKPQQEVEIERKVRENKL